MTGLIGVVVILLIAYLYSSNRKAIDWRLVAIGMLLQVSLAILVLGIPALGFTGPFRFLFLLANDAVISLLNFTIKGSEFLFGPLMDTQKIGYVFAFQVLPTIIFMASIMAVLYHLGVMQKVVKGLAWLMQKTLRISGAESLSTAANIFVGQTEAPLVVKPFVARMTRSELYCIMAGGMANAAGGVLAAYVGLLRDRIPDIAGHLITMSVMSAPASIIIAKMIVPETEKPETLGTLPPSGEKIDSNVIEAAARGASEGLVLAVNVGAMLLAFIALITMVNAGIYHVGHWIGFPTWGSEFVPTAFLTDGKAELTFQVILGWIFAPLAWVMGIPASEILTAGAFLGEKVVLNEFVAYLHLTEVANQLSDRTVLILSYALCGFANFSSIAIQIGGIGGMAPERRGELAQLGIRAVIGGSLATFLVATIAGLLN